MFVKRECCVLLFQNPLLSAFSFWLNATHLEFFQLLQDHVVRHVVEKPISGGEDDVTKLDIERRAVCGIRAAHTHRFKMCFVSVCNENTKLLYHERMAGHKRLHRAQAQTLWWWYTCHKDARRPSRIFVSYSLLSLSNTPVQQICPV